MKDDINPTELARNHWRYILSQMDVPPEALTGKHTACPHCGGEDRFRFDNNDGAGTYYCSGCGAGTGYSLIMKLRGVDFPGALELVKQIIRPDTPKDEPPRKPDMVEKKASLNRLWKSGRGGQRGVIDYLVSRGLSEETARRAAERIRFTDKAWLREKAEFVPAMLALVTQLSGAPVSIHRTFLLPDGGREKKLMPAVGDLMGAGIWFGPRTESRWIVGEGIETTLAGWEDEGYDGTAVAAISANGMEALEIPGHVTDLLIFADNDASFTGMKAASALAHRVATRKSPCEVTIAIPRGLGNDMADVISGDRGAGDMIYFFGGRDE